MELVDVVGVEGGGGAGEECLGELGGWGGGLGSGVECFEVSQLGEQFFVVFMEQKLEIYGVFVAGFLKMADEGCRGGIFREVGEEVELDVEVAEGAGGLADGFGGFEEVGGGVGVGQELEEGLDAAEGGAEVVEGFGVGFAAGGLESFAEGVGLVGEGWFVRVGGGVGHRDLVGLLDADLVGVSSGALF